MDVLLIRHGESANNVLWAGDRAAFYAARSDDPPLTPLGVRQAQAVADHLAATGERIDRLIASPMLRAIQTAQPIARALGLPVEIWVEVHEHGGMYVGNPETGEGFETRSGLSRAELTELLPDAVLPDHLGHEGWWTGGHEDERVCAVRTGGVLARLVDEAGRAADDRVAIVTHGAFADGLLAAAAGAPPGRVEFHHDNTGRTLLRFRPDGRVSIRYVNRTGHLEAAAHSAGGTPIHALRPASAG
jgi:broad specificity phosphatase PhoE